MITIMIKSFSYLHTINMCIPVYTYMYVYINIYVHTYIYHIYTDIHIYFIYLTMRNMLDCMKFEEQEK